MPFMSDYYRPAPIAPDAKRDILLEQIDRVLNAKPDIGAYTTAIENLISKAYQPQVEFYNNLLHKMQQQENPLLTGLRAFGTAFDAAARNPYAPAWAAAIQGAGAYGNVIDRRRQLRDALAMKLADLQAKKGVSLANMVAPLYKPQIVSPSTKANILWGMYSSKQRQEEAEADRKARERLLEKKAGYQKDLMEEQYKRKEDIERLKAKLKEKIDALKDKTKKAQDGGKKIDVNKIISKHITSLGKALASIYKAKAGISDKTQPIPTIPPDPRSWATWAKGLDPDYRAIVLNHLASLKALAPDYFKQETNKEPQDKLSMMERVLSRLGLARGQR